MFWRRIMIECSIEKNYFVRSKIPGGRQPLRTGLWWIRSEWCGCDHPNIVDFKLSNALSVRHEECLWRHGISEGKSCTRHYPSVLYLISQSCTRHTICQSCILSVSLVQDTLSVSLVSYLSVLYLICQSCILSVSLVQDTLSVSLVSYLSVLYKTHYLSVLYLICQSCTRHTIYQTHYLSGMKNVFEGTAFLKVSRLYTRS